MHIQQASQLAGLFFARRKTDKLKEKSKARLMQWVTDLLDWLYYRQHVFYIIIGLAIAVAWLWQNWLKAKELGLDEQRIRAITASCGECRERIWQSRRRK